MTDLDRIVELEAILGPYTMWGDGPYGASSEYRRELQIELARLKEKLGKPQNANWLVSSVLRTLYGIKI